MDEPDAVGHPSCMFQRTVPNRDQVALEHEALISAGDRCQRSPDESPKAMDTMQTPIVIELSRMSAHPDANPPSAGTRGPQTWRSVRGSRRRRTNATPGPRAA